MLHIDDNEFVVSDFEVMCMHLVKLVVFFIRGYMQWVKIIYKDTPLIYFTRLTILYSKLPPARSTNH